MFFYLFFLTSTLASASISNGVAIDFEMVSSAPVVTYGSSLDRCGQLLAHYNQLYHVSQDNVYQSALKGSLNSLTSVLNVTTLPNRVLDFGLSGI